MSQLSQFQSQSAQSQDGPERVPKTKEQYSRNVKKLKLRLKYVQEQIANYQKKINAYSNTSNDKIIAMKISKCCRERGLTPEMLFRFADKKNQSKITKEEFKQVLKGLGLKLSQHEMARLQYLLDEDISGDISKHQYYSYLHAYGIKGQFSADDPFLKNVLKKFDIDKIKMIADDKDRQTDVGKKHRHLLNYEEFLKYCHRHMPELNDKEIVSIFNRLEKNGLIDLDEFLNYLKKKQDQDQKLREKNRGKNKTSAIQKDQQVEQINTLKGILKAIFKNRPKHTKRLFHFSEFKRVQTLHKKPQGQLMNKFRKIDKNERGSFGFNEIIQFYIQRQPQDLLFTYEIMGRKMTTSKQKPEDIINQYNKGNKSILLSEFTNFMNKQFQTKEGDAKRVFSALANKQTKIPVRLIIDAMKLDESQKRIVYIKPSLWGAEGKDFFRKNSITILFNPFVALRFCLSITEEMKKSKSQYWDDFEFGPTFEDPFGSYSINMEIPTEEVKWLTVNSLGMNEFFLPIKGKKYIPSSFSPHQMFLKSLSLLVDESEDYLWSKKKLQLGVKNVQQKDLKPLFQGLYPLAFQSFAKYNLFVFRFFVKEKWAYVMIDGKIPCNSDNQPLFSISADRKHQWISLVEKAYAKIKGGYKNIFRGETNQYIYELSRRIPLEKKIDLQYKNQESKDKVWDGINSVKNAKIEQLYSLGNNGDRLVVGNIETGIIRNMPYKIQDLVEIDDPSCNNSHKSHRLLMIKGKNIKNQEKWNPNWHQGDGKNKFDEFQLKIDAALRAKKSKLQIMKQNNGVNILNFKLFRSIFDNLFLMKNPSFENLIILRKTIEFEQKYRCRYQMSSSEDITLIIALNQFQSPQNTIINICLSTIEKKNEKSKTLFEAKVSDRFNAVQLALPRQLCTLEIWVDNYHSGQNHAYSLTFYFSGPRFHLKQIDRHLLFHHVSPYQESKKLLIGECEEKERTYIYQTFYKGAERTRGCC